MPDEDTDRRLKAGQELQDLLVGRGFQSTFYVHEHTLHLPVGGHDVHVSQVHHLLLMGVRTNITIKIVPTAVGAHAGMNEAFTRLTFRAHEPLIFLEHEHSLLIEEDNKAVEAYQQVVRALDRASLDTERSKALLCRLGESLSAADFRERAGVPAAMLVQARP